MNIRKCAHLIQFCNSARHISAGKEQGRMTLQYIGIARMQLLLRLQPGNRRGCVSVHINADPSRRSINCRSAVASNIVARAVRGQRLAQRREGVDKILPRAHIDADRAALVGARK